MTITPLISEFTAIGELKDLTVKSNGRVKSLLLSTEEQEYSIKLPKDQPKKLIRQLQPGCKLEITGILKNKIKKEEVEYKASAIKLLAAPTTEVSGIEVPQLETLASKKSTTKSSKSKKSSGKILICKKSNCWKKGGKESYEVLKNELNKRGLAEEVDIKLTGCLNKCKKAPNLIALPDKKHYIKVKPKQVSTIVEKHLSKQV